MLGPTLSSLNRSPEGSSISGRQNSRVSESSMITQSELKQISRPRLEDSDVLLRAARYDGATYLCGYALELALKAKICLTLGWPGFPSTKTEFENYRSFRTHNLDVLLSLSGVEQEIKTKFLTQWSVVTNWDPEVRYKPIGSAKASDAKLMVESTKILLDAL